MQETQVLPAADIAFCALQQQSPKSTLKQLFSDVEESRFQTQLFGAQ